MGQGSEIKNITENRGILPINLGPARLEKSKHTFIHYFDLTPLFNEYNDLKIQHDNLRLSTSNHTHYKRELENYNKIVTFIRTNINNKINNIKSHSTINRTKRGLIDGLGKIVKVITGNLDAEDGQRYNKILEHMKINEYHLENQLKLAYSINHQIIDKFNDTVQNIQHNEIVLKSRIMQLNELVKNEMQTQDVLFAKDLYNQLIIIYNTILNILQDIENSISFYKFKTLHPSIIKPNELLSELKRISFYYKDQLPFEPEKENIFEYETLLEINCKIEPSQIIYFISVPINFEKEFELYYLFPLPTKYESEIVTIVPDIKYLLKSKENEIIPLNDICTLSKIYQCANQYHGHPQAICEEQILIKENSNECQFTKLSIKKNHIEIIPEINQYLAVFPEEERIKINCPDRTDIVSLTGIYLIKENNCEIYFKNQKLNFQDKTYGKPVLLTKIEFKLKNNKISNFSINLKTLKLKEININPAITTLKEESINMHVPSIWTIILYSSIILIGSYFLIKYLNNKKSNKNSPKTQEDIQLPEGASF